MQTENMHQCANEEFELSEYGPELNSYLCCQLSSQFCACQRQSCTFGNVPTCVNCQGILFHIYGQRGTNQNEGGKSELRIFKLDSQGGEEFLGGGGGALEKTVLCRIHTLSTHYTPRVAN